MDIKQSFHQAFGSRILQQSIMEEYQKSFAVGSEPSTLNAHDRAIYEAGVAKFENHPGKVSCNEAFRTVYNEKPDRLDVSGRCFEDSGSHYLSRHEQAFFSAYGVLPPIALKSVRPTLIDSVDQLCCGLVTHPGGGLDGLSATPAWMFDLDLLSLVMHPEIVERVASLLGDEITFLGSDGPMFLPPNSKKQTAWHAFDAADFGGGGKDGNLQLVSVWVALADANVANGCMKIAPGSFRAFGALEDVAPKFYGADTAGLVRLFTENESRVDPSVAARILARRLNDKNFPPLMRLGTTDKSPEGYRYNPFHSAVDRAWCLGEEGLSVLDECPKVALEAKKGEAYFFTSQNAHASFVNTTNGWRKAIAFRYVKTAQASESIITHTTLRMKGFLDLFPGARELIRSTHSSLEAFEEAAPRLCVRGSIPAGQEKYYFDPNVLAGELVKIGGTCLTRATLPSS